MVLNKDNSSNLPDLNAIAAPWQLNLNVSNESWHLFFSLAQLSKQKERNSTPRSTFCVGLTSTRLEKSSREKKNGKNVALNRKKFFSSTRTCFLSSLYNANFLIKSALLFGLHRKQPIHKTLSDCQFSLYPEATKTFIIVLAKTHRTNFDLTLQKRPTRPKNFLKTADFFRWKEPKQKNKYH